MFGSAAQQLHCVTGAAQLLVCTRLCCGPCRSAHQPTTSKNRNFIKIANLHLKACCCRHCVFFWMCASTISCFPFVFVSFSVRTKTKKQKPMRISVSQAYRKLALKWHPDKNQGSEEASAKFKVRQSTFRKWQTRACRLLARAR